MCSASKKTLEFRDGGGISASGMQSGLYMTDNDVNFEVRMKCFYVDWNEGKDKDKDKDKEREEVGWDYELTTTKEYLQDAISSFRIELEKYKNKWAQEK